LSTAIVVGAAMCVAAWVNRDLIRIKIASVYAHVPAKPSGANRTERATPAPLLGDAPWALSALPECLTQTSESDGSLAYVRGHLPPDAIAVRPPATLQYGDCSITVTGDEAYVRRGSDRLRIPPSVQFFRAEGLLALIRTTPQGAVLRVYEPANR
jgi:hypothetical protein